jgi:hypothetical protein
MAAKGIFYGAGQFGLITNDGNANIQLLVTEPLEFSIDGEGSEVVAKAQRAGRTVITGASLNEQNFTATVKIESVSWTALQIAYGLAAGQSANFLDPVSKRAKINTAGEIVDVDIFATVGPPAYLVPVRASSQADDFNYAEVAPATVNTALTPKQFKIDRTNTKLVFNPSEAGKTVNYQLVKPLTVAETIGKEAAVRKFDNMSFSAIGYGNGGTEHSKIIVPEMSRISVPTLSMSGSQTALEIKYRLVQTDESEGLPFILRKLH